MRNNSLFVAFALALSLTGAARAESVQHIVMFQFKESTTPSEIQEVTRRFADLPNKIPGVTGFQWGTNNSPEGLNDGLTHAFCMTFESQAALDAYAPHAAHLEFIDFAVPKVEKVFVNDFAVDSPASAAEPGRTHHLVFFKYKDDAKTEDLEKVREAFRGLEAKIPGILSIQTGSDRTPERFQKGFVHCYWLTFTNERARNDYLPHPAHKEFVEVLLPHLDKPLVLDFTVRPSSRSLFVTHGLEPYRVYQRNEKDVASLKFGGVCSADGTIEARLRQGRRTAAGFDWAPVGQAKGGSFEAEIKNVPAGGEYTVEVRRRDKVGNVAAHTEVADILVGDIWILAGQSNMEGVGDLVDVEEADPLVNCFTMGHRWENAREPLHWLVDSPDSVHSGRYMNGVKNEADRRARRAANRARRTKGAGLGLPFAKAMVQATGVPVGLIAAAHGGTSMQQWDPAGKERGGLSLYGSMHKQVMNAGGKVRGVLWYQGESDANPGAVPLFAERFEGLIAAFRKDLGADLPFYYVQIGQFVRSSSSDSWDQIQELQRKAESIPNTAMISVIDLQLDDLIHVGTRGLKRAGQRLAKIAQKELFGAEHLERGPRPSKITASANRRELRVHFDGVNGRLRPETLVKGFTAHQADGKDMETIYDAFVDPVQPNVVVLKLQNGLPADGSIWYGRGLHPTCNLVDDEDMAAPVFGPMRTE